MNNLFLFTGSEAYFLRQRIRFWKEEFKKKHGEMNLSALDAQEKPLAEIRAEIETLPFLGARRLIFIENLPEAPRARTQEKEEDSDPGESEALAKFAEALKDIPETSVVVFVQPHPDKRKGFYKALAKIAKKEEFIPLEGAVLASWLQREAQGLRITLDALTADYLISLVGQDAWRLSQELQKLSNFHPDSPITRADIDQTVVPNPEANIFHFTDALSAKDHKKAIQNLHRSMAAGENLRQLFYMIVRQFRLLLQVQSYRELYPTSTPLSVASSLKLHPFVAKNLLDQIRSFKPEELKKAYGELLEIDSDLKSSRIRVTTDDQDELALAVEQFILKFCV